MLTQVTGGITPYDGSNPVFVVIDLDPETLFPLDIHSYSFDLFEANARGPDIKPDWHKIYSYKEQFNMPDLSPKSFQDVAN